MLTPVVLAELQQRCATCEDCKTGIECSITFTQSVMALVEIDSDETDGTGVDTAKGTKLRHVSGVISNRVANLSCKLDDGNFSLL